MRGTNATLIAIGATDYENGNDEAHTCDLVQAHLIETLSAIGREHIDIYYFRVRQMPEEYQLSGALQALELAKQEGHVGHIGLCCDGPSFATLGAWQFHDAFETLLVPRNHYSTEAYDTLAPLARERRVGIVTNSPLNWGSGESFTQSVEDWDLQALTQRLHGKSLVQSVIADLAVEHPVLVGVRSPHEVEQAITSPSLTLPEGLPAMLQPFIESFKAASTQKFVSGSATNR